MIIDLDEYRKQREAEGTWPREDHLHYWFNRKTADGKKPGEFLSEFGRKWLERIRNDPD